jgi:hypothetical protein
MCANSQDYFEILIRWLRADEQSEVRKVVRCYLLEKKWPKDGVSALDEARDKLLDVLLNTSPDLRVENWDPVLRGAPGWLKLLEELFSDSVHWETENGNLVRGTVVVRVNIHAKDRSGNEFKLVSIEDAIDGHRPGINSLSETVSFADLEKCGIDNNRKAYEIDDSHIEEVVRHTALRGINEELGDDYLVGVTHDSLVLIGSDTTQQDSGYRTTVAGSAENNISGKYRFYDFECLVGATHEDGERGVNVEKEAGWKGHVFQWEIVFPQRRPRGPPPSTLHDMVLQCNYLYRNMKGPSSWPVKFYFGGDRKIRMYAGHALEEKKSISEIYDDARTMHLRHHDRDRLIKPRKAITEAEFNDCKISVINHYAEECEEQELAKKLGVNKREYLRKRIYLGAKEIECPTCASEDECDWSEEKKGEERMKNFTGGGGPPVHPSRFAIALNEIIRSDLRNEKEAGKIDAKDTVKFKEGNDLEEELPGVPKGDINRWLCKVGVETQDEFFTRAPPRGIDWEKIEWDDKPKKGNKKLEKPLDETLYYRAFTYLRRGVSDSVENFPVASLFNTEAYFSAVVNDNNPRWSEIDLRVRNDSHELITLEHPNFGYGAKKSFEMPTTTVPQLTEEHNHLIVDEGELFEWKADGSTPLLPIDAPISELVQLLHFGGNILLYVVSTESDEIFELAELDIELGLVPPNRADGAPDGEKPCIGVSALANARSKFVMTEHKRKTEMRPVGVVNRGNIMPLLIFAQRVLNSNN